MTAALDSVRWGETEIVYALSFEARRSLQISVDPDQRVLVVAPEHSSVEDVRRRVLKRASWIVRAQRSFEMKSRSSDSRHYRPGATHRYLGRQYRLRWIEAEVAPVKLTRGFLLIQAPILPGEPQMKALVDRWLRERAKDVFARRLATISAHRAFRRLDTPTFTVRRMRSRWGSCTESGRLQLNPNLVAAPSECVDYVLAHELCHLLEHNHGPRFWRFLASVVPDFAARREKLAGFAQD